MISVRRQPRWYQQWALERAGRVVIEPNVLNANDRTLVKPLRRQEARAAERVKAIHCNIQWYRGERLKEPGRLLGLCVTPLGAICTRFKPRFGNPEIREVGPLEVVSLEHRLGLELGGLKEYVLTAGTWKSDDGPEKGSDDDGS